MYKLEPFSYSYGKSSKAKKIFLETNLTFNKNEMIAIVGPSGGGKSTLLKVLKGIIPEYSSGEFKGEVTFHGMPLSGVNFQENLQKILYAIETQQPYLIVDGLTIRPLNAFRGFKPAPGVEPEVSVLLDVIAFSNTGAEKP